MSVTTSPLMLLGMLMMMGLSVFDAVCRADDGDATTTAALWPTVTLVLAAHDALLDATWPRYQATDDIESYRLIANATRWDTGQSQLDQIRLRCNDWRFNTCGGTLNVTMTVHAPHDSFRMWLASNGQGLFFDDVVRTTVQGLLLTHPSSDPIQNVKYLNPRGDTRWFELGVTCTPTAACDAYRAAAIDPTTTTTTTETTTTVLTTSLTAPTTATVPVATSSTSPTAASSASTVVGVTTTVMTTTTTTATTTTTTLTTATTTTAGPTASSLAPVGINSSNSNNNNSEAATAWSWLGPVVAVVAAMALGALCLAFYQRHRARRNSKSDAAAAAAGIDSDRQLHGLPQSFVNPQYRGGLGGAAYEIPSLRVHQPLYDNEGGLAATTEPAWTEQQPLPEYATIDTMRSRVQLNSATLDDDGDDEVRAQPTYEVASGNTLDQTPPTLPARNSNNAFGQYEYLEVGDGNNGGGSDTLASVHSSNSNV